MWWVPLADLRVPELVLETAARSLGAKEPLPEHIGDARMLILFDNFEHLVTGAPPVAVLLESCPNLDVLATSREPLHLRGEQEYAVPPFVREGAAGFFAARARAVLPTFTSDENVLRICERLDELPLALELAAGRVKALTTSQILERLDRRLPLLTTGTRDAPDRHRTLRATIAWSYDLLRSEEQRLFGRLAVFRGGWTLGDAETVCDADLDLLQSLVDKSLVRHLGGRYRMLETIREFAAGFADDETRRRHADHFEALVHEARPHIAETAWADRLESENDNVLAAIDWLCTGGDFEAALRTAAGMSVLWQNHGWPEGRRWLRGVLDRDETPTQARVRSRRRRLDFSAASKTPTGSRGSCASAAGSSSRRSTTRRPPSFCSRRAQSGSRRSATRQGRSSAGTHSRSCAACRATPRAHAPCTKRSAPGPGVRQRVHRERDVRQPR